MENTISDVSATARGVSAHAMPASISGVGLVARAVPAGDAVSGRHQARDDQRAHGAKADEADLHGYFQNSLLAILAPSASAANFAHTTSGSTAACPTQVP